MNFKITPELNSKLQILANVIYKIFNRVRSSVFLEMLFEIIAMQLLSNKFRYLVMIHVFLAECINIHD